MITKLHTPNAQELPNSAAISLKSTTNQAYTIFEKHWVRFSSESDLIFDREVSWFYSVTPDKFLRQNLRLCNCCFVRYPAITLLGPITYKFRNRRVGSKYNKGILRPVCCFVVSVRGDPVCMWDEGGCTTSFTRCV